MPRPFWSVMIPTFNPRPGLSGAGARRACSSRTPVRAEMEIAVIDDHSTRGRSRGVACRPPLRDRISWFRQETTCRHRRTTGTPASPRARGQWVHILHQDDMVRPGFYARLREGIGAAPAVAGAAFCRDVVIDADGNEQVAQVLVRDTPGIDRRLDRARLRGAALCAPRRSSSGAACTRRSAGSRPIFSTRSTGTCGSGSPPRTRSGTSPPSSRATGDTLAPRPSASCGRGRTSPRYDGASSCPKPCSTRRLRRT